MARRNTSFHLRFCCWCNNPISERNKVLCNSCSDLKFTTPKFIKKAKEIHGEKYDYSSIKETSIKNVMLNLLCKACNETFRASYTSHVVKKIGCPCNINEPRISTEDEHNQESFPDEDNECVIYTTPDDYEIYYSLYDGISTSYDDNSEQYYWFDDYSNPTRFIWHNY